MLRPRVRLAAAALCSGLFACAASPAPAPSSTPEVAAAPAAAPAEPTKSLVGGEGLAEARAQEITAEIVAQVSEVRGLPITRPFEVVVRDRAQLKAFAQASMHEHYSDAEIKLFGRIDASLGIIPPGADIERLLLGLLEQSVMGIYDPKARALLIGAHVTESMLPMVSGHEIAHGLQDMHFDLKSMQQPLRGQSDRETIQNAEDAASVPQALTMLNSNIFETVTNGASVIGRAMAVTETPESKIETLFLGLLNRPPTAEETALVLADLESRGDDLFKDTAFALLNSQEFYFVK